MAKFAAGLFGLIISLVISVLIMIHGWGLEPRNWWWILGMGLVNIIIGGIVGVALKEGK